MRSFRPTLRRPAAWHRSTPLLPVFAIAAVFAGCAGAGTQVALEPAATGSRVHDGRTFVASAEQAAFEAQPGATAFHGIHRGIHGDAGYRIEVPDDWNGVLVMYAHGYRGVGPNLTVGNPALRAYLIENGYAWAASSYSANFYDVRAGVEDTNALALAFPEITGLAAPAKYYITGHSMGGHVTGAAIEREALRTARNRVRYSGAVPMCGVMGDIELPAYFVAFNYAAHQLAGFPPPTFPIPDHEALLPEILSVLWVDYEEDRGDVTSQGARLKAILMNLSGGERPLFDEAFPNFMNQLLGYGTFEGTWSGVVTGNVIDTRGIVFRFDDNGGLTVAERAFNERIYRVDGDTERSNPIRSDGIRWIPRVHGEVDIPVVSIHTLGDLFVPFSMQQIYRRRAQEQGTDDWIVQRAIRGPAHCGFTVEEEIAAFQAMVDWEVDGRRPEGDDILDPATIAHPEYGCTFTTADRSDMPPCPTHPGESR
jgi:hypothetical protein